MQKKLEVIVHLRYPQKASPKVNPTIQSILCPLRPRPQMWTGFPTLYLKVTLSKRDQTTLAQEVVETLKKEPQIQGLTVKAVQKVPQPQKIQSWILLCQIFVNPKECLYVNKPMSVILMCRLIYLENLLNSKVLDKVCFKFLTYTLPPKSLHAPKFLSLTFF